MIEKYSKSSSPMLDIKKEFFDSNDKLLKEAVETNELYSEQEPRLNCKNCEDPIGQEAFNSFGVSYSLCNNCGHLNGIYEDSEKFTQYLYSEDNGDHYKESYLKDYDRRVQDIYTPKVQFLIDVVGRCTVNDVGCGAGHFVKACENLGVGAIGVDPNRSLIELGKQKMLLNHIAYASPKDFEWFIEGSTDVVSMIGVLEHLREPNKALEAFNRSLAEYLYISVPLLSPSVFIEHSFPTVFPRHLRAAHTHLYTKESLEYMANKYNLEVVGQWWFGSDAMDLYRSMLVKAKGNQEYVKLLKKYVGSHIDELQQVFDKSHMSSEVHLILEKKK